MYYIFDKENSELVPCKTKADTLRQLEWMVESAKDYMGIEEMYQQFEVIEGEKIELNFTVKVGF